MDSLKEIERAIDGLPPHQLTELYAWLDQHRPALLGRDEARPDPTLAEQGLGLFGTPDDAALIDDVVELAYEERRRPSRPSPSL